MILLINAGVNYFMKGQKFALFWGYIVNFSDMHNSTSSMIKEAIFSLVNNIGETFLMCFTTENIDFKNYLIVLMKGKRAFKLMPHTSIYLLYRPQKFPSRYSSSIMLLTEDSVLQVEQDNYASCSR